MSSNVSDLGVTDIARLIGVTKGAVSQTLKRIEKKGLAQKQKDPDNRSKLLVSLTALGNMAYWAHKHWHETMDGGFITYLENLNSDQTEFLLDFLTRVENFLQRRMFQNPVKIAGPYIRPGDTIIDFGCGPGYFTAAMAQLTGPNGKVWAVDLQPEMLEKVKKKCHELGLSASVNCHRCSQKTID
ncbi:MAG: methyltransferase domain-containing protein, partial [Desulfotignum sp.]|nr:methyltransferase domain-containing protein [Desulfotignum sp.]